LAVMRNDDEQVWRFVLVIVLGMAFTVIGAIVVGGLIAHYFPPVYIYR
jgi:hypothetical protein